MSNQNGLKKTQSEVAVMKQKFKRRIEIFDFLSFIFLLAQFLVKMYSANEILSNVFVLLFFISCIWFFWNMISLYSKIIVLGDDRTKNDINIVTLLIELDFLKLWEITIAKTIAFCGILITKDVSFEWTFPDIYILATIFILFVGNYLNGKLARKKHNEITKNDYWVTMFLLVAVIATLLLPLFTLLMMNIVLAFIVTLILLLVMLGIILCDNHRFYKKSNPQ